MLTWEFLRKAQLEPDEIAAQQIQRTLQPERIAQVSGYLLESFYKPFREVGGDYFDVVDLPGSSSISVTDADPLTYLMRAEIAQ